MFLLGRLALLGWAAVALAGCGVPLYQAGGPNAGAGSVQGRPDPGFLELAAAADAEEGASDADGLVPDATEGPTGTPAATAEQVPSQEAFEEITIMRGRSIEVIRVPLVREEPVEPEPPVKAKAPPAKTPDAVDDEPTVNDSVAPPVHALGEAATLSEVAVPDDARNAPAVEDVPAVTQDGKPSAPSAIDLGEAGPLSAETAPEEAVDLPSAAEAVAETRKTGSITIPLAAPIGEAARLSDDAVPFQEEKASVNQEGGGATQHAGPVDADPSAELQEARVAPEVIVPETNESAVAGDVDEGPVVGTYIVFFDSGTADLNNDAREILAEVVRAAGKTTFSAIRASGHSDPMGSEDYNEWLSEQRTLAVVDFLVASGLDKQRIVTESYGSTDPLIPAAGELAQMQNRRVEIQFLK